MYHVLIYQGRCPDNSGDLRVAVLPDRLIKKFINKEILSNVQRLASPVFSLHSNDYAQKPFLTQKDAIQFCEEWDFQCGGLYTFRDSKLWLGYYRGDGPPMRLIKGGKFENTGAVLSFKRT